MKPPRTAPPDYDTKARQDANLAFNVSRSQAINEYATLEMYLGHLFAFLIGVSGPQAFAAFAAIDSAQKRLNAIKQLLNLAYGEEFDPFFDSLSRLALGLSGTRNKVVHWIALNSHNPRTKFDPRKDIYLRRHPDIFSKDRFYKHEIDDFKRRTHFVGLMIFYFKTYLKHPLEVDDPPASHRPWREIFHEEMQFPPPPGHPLRELHEKGYDRRQS